MFDESMEVSAESIDEYIKRGIYLGKKKKRRRRLRLISSISAAAVFIIMITSIRNSTAFAAYLSRIPGLEYIVKIINYDKGIDDAVDNNFVQHINQSQQYEGINFTIKDIIADDSKCILFYNIENKSSHKFVNLDEMELKDEKGKDLEAGISWGPTTGNDLNNEKRVEGAVDISFLEGACIPDELFINVKLKESNERNAAVSGKKLAPVWNFKVPIDKKKFSNMKRVYEINQSINVEGQNILFKKMTITPTRIAVDVEYDKDNSKKILNYDDLEIIDEKGEKRATITNGISASFIDENHATLYFQSNFFTDVKRLYIKGSSIRAIDKDKLKVLVDLENKKLLKFPDNLLSLKAINSSSKGIDLEFELKKADNIDKERAYNIFSLTFEDKLGKSYNSNVLSSRDNKSNIETEIYSIPNDKNIKGPIELTVEDYPERIKGEFNVRVK